MVRVFGERTLSRIDGIDLRIGADQSLTAASSGIHNGRG